jgi:lipopolysaccharide transport system ATP-binding protein
MKSIELQGVSKQFRLGELSGRTLREDVSRWWSSLGEAESLADTSEFWALKDIDISIDQGEVVGVIGRNGAGKSTLLKLLARITAPTEGVIRMRGQVGSLLEVGSGFHPDLTGLENIYLNGAILGMTRGDVTRNLDDIVEFSGVKDFLDTPIKRYSYGMGLRLAFSVAAHLNSDILLVDEVLAVGDVEFRKRCVEKMEDVANHGKTILFVSHSMSVVGQLCTRGVLLDKGRLVADGSIDDIIAKYVASASSLERGEYQGALSDVVKIMGLSVDGSDVGAVFQIEHIEDILITVRGQANRSLDGFRLYLSIERDGYLIAQIMNSKAYQPLVKGEFEVSFVLPTKLLRDGSHWLSVGADTGRASEWLKAGNVMQLNIFRGQYQEGDVQEAGLITLDAYQTAQNR